MPYLCICKNCRNRYYLVAKNSRNMDAVTFVHDYKFKHKTANWELHLISEALYRKLDVMLKRKDAVKHKLIVELRKTL